MEPGSGVRGDLTFTFSEPCCWRQEVNQGGFRLAGVCRACSLTVQTPDQLRDEQDRQLCNDADRGGRQEGRKADRWRKQRASQTTRAGKRRKIQCDVGRPGRNRGRTAHLPQRLLWSPPPPLLSKRSLSISLLLPVHVRSRCVGSIGIIDLQHPGRCASHFRTGPLANH